MISLFKGMLWLLGIISRFFYYSNIFFISSCIYTFCLFAVDIEKLRKNKRPISEVDFLEKKQDGYFTGIPIVVSDSDEGLGLGGRLTYYFNGKKKDALFRYTPYLHKLYAQAFVATRGLQFYTVNYDAPYILGSSLRLRASLLYLINTNANFYGLGESTLARLTDNHLNSYTSFSDYSREIRKIDANGNTNARFNKYILRSAGGQVSFERDTWYVFSGIIRPSLGIKIAKIQINDYSFQSVKVGDVDATQGKTRLLTAQENGQVIGFNGGWQNILKAALVYDSRDFEPDPNRGFFIELIGEFSRREFGSGFDFSRYTFAPKFYYSPFPKQVDLTLAVRGVYAVTQGDTPFYAQGRLSFTEREVLALGGANTIRGFKANRFVGPVIALANFEIRYSYFSFHLFDQFFKWMFIPFIDVGRVYNNIAGTNLSNLKIAYGFGLRSSWNQASVGSADIAFSKEGIGVFLKANHIF